MKKNVGAQGPPGMRKNDSPKQIFWGENFFLNFLRRFLLHNSLLSPIVVGFEVKFECAVKKATNLAYSHVERLD